MIWAIVVLALAVRIGWALVGTQVDPFLRADPLNGDAASYERAARSLLAGTGFSQTPPVPDAFWPPLYPFFLAGAHWLLGPELMPVRIVHAGLGALTVVLCFLLARDLIGHRLALVAALGAAIHPFLIYWGNWLVAEALLMPFFVGALLAMLRTARRGTGLAATTFGVLMGLAILTKPAIQVIGLLLVAWLVACGERRMVAQRVRLAIVALLTMVLTILPWTVRNYAVFGEVIPVSANGGYVFYGANNEDGFGGQREFFPPLLPGLTPGQQEKEYYRRGLAWIQSDPGGWLRLTIAKVVRLWSPLTVSSQERPLEIPLAGFLTAAYLAFSGVSAAGLVLAARRFPDTSILWMPVLGTHLAAVVFYGGIRYSVPMIPAMLTFCAVAVGAFLHLWSSTKGAR